LSAWSWGCISRFTWCASVIGLAVGFGSQGVVQDVVIGMRFLVLENSHGALVNVPNRTVTNVIAYPRGYVRLICDVSLADDEDLRRQMIALTERLVPTVAEQFPGIMRSPPSVAVRRERRLGLRRT